MRRLVAGVAATAWLAVTAAPAYAAVVDVTVGNFYFEDASSGDGEIDANVGDQLRFVVQDGGGGTPHTVEVDELGIHSGSLAAGETYTTGALSKAGRFRLYCKPHNRRGHVTTLVVRGTAPSPAPTKAPTRSPGPGTAPSPAPSNTAAPAGSRSSGSGGTPSGSAPVSMTTSSTATSSASPGALAPTGRGKASPQALVSPPAAPGSLTDLLGREPATAAPWTRAVRQSLAVLVLLAVVAGYADRVARARGRAGPQPPV